MASGGPYLRSLAQARQVPWGKSWQWDSRFIDAPAPFNTWFPATEAKRDVAELQSHKFIGFGDTHEIPFASGIRTFSTTFLDDDAGTLMQFFTDWMETITLCDGLGTNRLSNIVRVCDLAMCDSMHRPVRQWRLQVFPFGNFSFTGNSDSRFQTYMLSFRIAGIINLSGL